jgi:putative transcriptional regulator
MYVSGLIRERRKERGWSQQDLAEHVSATRNPINRWERGWNGPTLPQRRKLAKALGGDPDEYMWTEEDHVHRDEQTPNQIEVRDLIRRLRGSDLSLQNGPARPHRNPIPIEARDRASPARFRAAGQSQRTYSRSHRALAR